MNFITSQKIRSNSVITPLKILMVVSLFTLSTCTGNQSQITPQVLTFNYAIRTYPDATIVSSLISALNSGDTSVADLLRVDPCNFTANFAVTPSPQIVINGSPGQTGFNLRIASANPVNITTTNPQNCSTPEEIEINIGGRNEALSVGGHTSHTNGRMWLTGNNRFSTSDFFQAQLNGFNTTSRRASGTFQFADRLPGSNTTLLLVDGTYAITP